MPTPASITEVRKFAAQAFELRAYLLRPEVKAQRSAMGIEPATHPLRMPTEAEVMRIAAALDAGVLINPRLWNIEFADVAAEQAVAA